MTGFDFAAIAGHLEDQEQGRDIPILLPGTGQPTGMKVTVAGPDSERVKRAVRWGRDKLNASDSLSDEAREDIQNEVTARSCSGWSGAVFEGQEVPFSIEKATWWFKRWPFVQRQVTTATGDVGRFMNGLPNVSAKQSEPE